MILKNKLNKLKKRVILGRNFSSSSLGTFKNELLEEIKIAKFNDLEDMVYQLDSTYDELCIF